MLQKSELTTIFSAMKQIFILLILLALNLMSSLVKADGLQLAVQKIEAQWADIHYSVAKERQEVAYKQLLADVKTIQRQYPDQAELIIQQAIIVASNAANIDAFNALSAIHQARDLLLHAIELNPNASDGAAFVALGSLYYMVPSWPIAYGDNEKAQKMLQAALTINPDTIDANYFYADFLVTRGQQREAMTYFKRAIAIPVRATQVFADSQLHAQAKRAMIENSQLVAVNQQILSVAYGEK